MDGWMKLGATKCYRNSSFFFFFFPPSFGESMAMAYWNVSQRGVIARASVIDLEGTNTCLHVLAGLMEKTIIKRA